MADSVELGTENPDVVEDTADRLVAGVQGAWVSVVLTLGLVLTHILVGLIPYSRGRFAWWGVLVSRRGPRILARCGAMRSSDVDDGEFWRLVSAAFLHVDGLHLLVNTSSLFIVGRVVEAVYGPVRFFNVFLLSAMFGSWMSWSLGHTEESVGASGGVFGLLGVIVVFGWRHRSELPDDLGRLFRRRVAAVAVGNLALGIPLAFIDNYAHVGGLLTGIILGMLLENRVTPTASQRGLSTAAWATFALVLVGSAGRGVVGNWWRGG